MYICMYGTYIIRMYVCMYVCMYVLHVCICVFIVLINKCNYVCTYVQRYVRMYANTYVCMNVHVCKAWTMYISIDACIRQKTVALHVTSLKGSVQFDAGGTPSVVRA